MKKQNILRKLIREEIKNILLKEVKIADYATAHGIEVGLTVNFKFGTTGMPVRAKVSNITDEYIEVQVPQTGGSFFAVQVTNPEMAKLRLVKQVKPTATSEE